MTAEEKEKRERDEQEEEKERVGGSLAIPGLCVGRRKTKQEEAATARQKYKRTTSPHTHE